MRSTNCATASSKAITALGSGFLAHPANNGSARSCAGRAKYTGLLPPDTAPRLPAARALVAEDRDILFHPEADLVAASATPVLFDCAAAPTGRTARWHAPCRSLPRTAARYGETRRRRGCPELGLPALDSFLFSREAISDLADCEIANHDLLDAIRSLAFIDDRACAALVDYRNLGSEELGSVYESLLELHPLLHIEARKFELTEARGNERKTTGSYYTPTSLITCLLDSALDPVLDEACAKPDPETAILNLKVCDPACGSGHFLIAAAHRIAKRLAAVRTGEEEPAPEARRKALRDFGHCIYG